MPVMAWTAGLLTLSERCARSTTWIWIWSPRSWWHCAPVHDPHLPGVDVEHGVQRMTRRRLERVTDVVGGGNEDALPDVGRDPEEL